MLHHGCHLLHLLQQRGLPDSLAIDGGDDCESDVGTGAVVGTEVGTGSETGSGTGARTGVGTKGGGRSCKARSLVLSCSFFLPLKRGMMYRKKIFFFSERCMRLRMTHVAFPSCIIILRNFVIAICVCIAVIAVSTMLRVVTVPILNSLSKGSDFNMAQVKGATL